MHHHNVSGCLLCVRQLWGGQSQDEVSLMTQIKYNTCIKIELAHKLSDKWPTTVISGSSPRPSSVPSPYDTTHTPRVWTSSRTLQASTAWWRSSGTSLTLSATPSADWTSSWVSDGPCRSYPLTLTLLSPSGDCTVCLCIALRQYNECAQLSVKPFVVLAALHKKLYNLQWTLV